MVSSTRRYQYRTLIHGRCIEGSYGSLPIPVRAACDKLSTRIEANPDKFLRIEYIQHWIEARTRVAKLIGADTDECVLVNNTSHGISTILRNFEWHEGDIIIGSRSRITILKFPYLLLFPFPMKQRTQLIMPCPERLGISEISHHTHKYLHSIFSSQPHMQIYWKTGENISAE